MKEAGESPIRGCFCSPGKVRSGLIRLGKGPNVWSVFPQTLDVSYLFQQLMLQKNLIDFLMLSDFVPKLLLLRESSVLPGREPQAEAEGALDVGARGSTLRIFPNLSLILRDSSSW